jgi:hypothetical protein
VSDDKLFLKNNASSSLQRNGVAKIDFLWGLINGALHSSHPLRLDLSLEEQCLF